MGNMRLMVWQLVCLLLGLLDYSIAPPFILVLALHLIPKLARAVVLSLLLLLLELPGNLRHYWVRASQRLRSHPPSTSRLLLLPPELRQMIWTMLLGDFEYVHIRHGAPILYTSYTDRLRLYMGKNPRYFTNWFSMGLDWRLLQPHLTCMQSCRQIHKEAGYNAYSNNTFYFNKAKVLESWVRSLTPAHKRDVRDIEIAIPNMVIYYRSGGVITNALTRDAASVRFAIEELSGLRKLDIQFATNNLSLPTTEHEALLVYHLVRNVKVYEVLIVQMLEDSPSPYDRLTEAEWPAHSQEDFAYAVWARIRWPGSALQQRVQVEEGSQAKYVLKIWE